MLTVFLLITALCPAVTWQVNKLWSIGRMSPYHAVLLDFNQLVHSVPFPWPEILGMSNLFFKISVIERKKSANYSNHLKNVKINKCTKILKTSSKWWNNKQVMQIPCIEFPQTIFSLSISYSTNSMLISTISK